MATYVRVLNGEVISTETDFSGPPPVLSPNKGAWLPLVVIDPAFDPVTQTKTGPVTTVSDTEVTQTFTVWPLNANQIQALRDAKRAENSAEFDRRNALPITFTLASGVTKDFDADDQAVTRIMGIVLLIQAGAPVPDPRPWTAHNDLAPTMLTHADLIGLGGAIAAREDQLFVTKKTIDAQVASLVDAASVIGFDTLVAWGA